MRIEHPGVSVSTTDLFGPQAPARKSASHGEAGYARNARDAYFTEPWVTRALLKAVDFVPEGRIPATTVIWEPACGDGRMCQVIDEWRLYFVASDIHDYGYSGTVIGDFFRTPRADILPPDALSAGVDAVITNPPFDLAREVRCPRAADHRAEARQGRHPPAPRVRRAGDQPPALRVALRRQTDPPASTPLVR